MCLVIGSEGFFGYSLCFEVRNPSHGCILHLQGQKSEKFTENSGVLSCPRPSNVTLEASTERGFKALPVLFFIFETQLKKVIIRPIADYLPILTLLTVVLQKQLPSSSDAPRFSCGAMDPARGFSLSSRPSKAVL